MRSDNDNAGIFRDQYGVVLKDNPRQIILEVEHAAREVCASCEELRATAKQTNLTASLTKLQEACAKREGTAGTAEDDYICYGCA